MIKTASGLLLPERSVSPASALLHLPRYREIRRQVEVKPKMAGYFKLTAIRPDGRERPLTGWFPNLIVDAGLNQIGSAFPLIKPVVGTDNTAPTTGDTGLGNEIAISSTSASFGYSAQGSSPYYASLTDTFRFNAGVATGNLSECGMAYSSAGGAPHPLFSHALIVDGGGTPTTVTVLSDEALDLAYELRIYPPTTDVTGSTTLNSISEDYTIRACSVTDYTYWAACFTDRAKHVSVPVPYEGPIGAITASNPSGGTGSNGTYSTGSYSADSYYVDITSSFGLSATQPTSGYGAIAIRTTLGKYQVGWDPSLIKDSTMILDLTFRLSWAAH